MTKKCGDWENCVAYDKNSSECQKNNGCMTPENVKAYLEWAGNALREEEKRAKKP